MSQNLISEREAIARAACDVAGREWPLSTAVPEENRVYLYAHPADEPGQFSADDLSDRLSSNAVVHGVNWDRKSPNFGLRFVTSSEVLPAEVRPFSSNDAMLSWRDWKAKATEEAAVAAEAAVRCASGEKIEFVSEEEILSGVKPRRRQRSSGERD